MNRDEYIALVRAAMKPRKSSLVDNADDLIDLIRLSWNHDEEHMRLRRELYDAMSDAPLRIPGYALFYPLAEAKKPIEDTSLMDSWLYDRTVGVVILNARRGAHESLAASLFCAYTGSPRSIAPKDTARAAEQFIESGLGWFLSSAGSRPLKPASVKLTAQERAVFSARPFREML